MDREGNPVIVVEYVADDSPLLKMYDKNNEENTSENFGIEAGNIVSKVSYLDKASSLTRNGAQQMILELNSSDDFREIVFTSLGGGIRGSLVSTLWTIFLTLIIALPVGIFSAIYLNEFAPKNKFTSVIRSFIETLTGVPIL